MLDYNLNISKNIDMDLFLAAIIGTNVDMYKAVNLANLADNKNYNLLYEITHFADLTGNVINQEPEAVDLISN